jgi:hypothetical protein
MLLLITTFSLQALLSYGGRKNALLFTIGFLVIVALQVKSTHTESLLFLDSEARRIRDLRILEYPPVVLKFGDRNIQIPLGYWFEGRKESTYYYRLTKNLAEIVDPNLYFFANHPRERAGFKEFEKFPYILFPLFVIGTLVSIKLRNKKFLLASFIIPACVLTFIGSTNPFGPFSLFPFLTVSISIGVSWFNKVFWNKGKFAYRLVFFGFWIYFVLNLIQVIAYEYY